MFRWLSRYVKKIEIYGVGIELREIPPEEGVPLLKAAPPAGGCARQLISQVRTP